MYAVIDNNVHSITDWDDNQFEIDDNDVWVHVDDPGVKIYYEEDVRKLILDDVKRSVK